MNKLVKVLTLLILPLCLVACSDETKEEVEPTIEVNYVTLHGTWMLSEWNGNDIPEGCYMYIDFDRSEQTFIIYQKFDSMYGRKITGEFSLEKDYYKGHIISGSYDFENGDWNNEYIITDMLKSGSMIWTVDGNEQDVCKYVRCDSIPQQIIDEATRPEIKEEEE